MGGRIRILTANLLNGGADPEALADTVRRYQVDVAAVQELSHSQAEVLSEELPFGSLEPAGDHSGMGIALRRPGSGGRLPLPRRDALVAQLPPESWGTLGQTVEVVNVHVSAPHLMPTWRTLAQRRGQLRALLDHLHATRTSRQLLVGDFNATPLWPFYRRLASHRQDAARVDARLRGGRARPTWGPWAGGPRVLRIDHAFVQGLRVLALHVVRIPGSDHSAVVVEVEG
jgi:endonuclease/exonuclease/phosphatase (EEP) superfamily protein YafD